MLNVLKGQSDCRASGGGCDNVLDSTSGYWLGCLSHRLKYIVMKAL